MHFAHQFMWILSHPFMALSTPVLLQWSKHTCISGLSVLSNINSCSIALEMVCSVQRVPCPCKRRSSGLPGGACLKVVKPFIEQRCVNPTFVTHCINCTGYFIVEPFPLYIFTFKYSHRWYDMASGTCTSNNSALVLITTFHDPDLLGIKFSDHFRLPWVKRHARFIDIVYSKALLKSCAL